MKTILATFKYKSGQILEIGQGDLTFETVDAMVNVANLYLAHVGGIAAANVRRGGEQIQAESDVWVNKHGPVKHADPAYTSGGNLPCRFVIHAVGPIWGNGDEYKKSKDAILGSMQLAGRLKLKSIAFPAISTGIFSSSKERAARIFYQTFRQFFEKHPSTNIQLIRLVLFDLPALQAFLNVFENWKNTLPECEKS